MSIIGIKMLSILVLYKHLNSAPDHILYFLSILQNFNNIFSKMSELLYSVVFYMVQGVSHFIS